MEILYYWIGCINSKVGDIGINLSSEYNISYSKLDRCLTIEKNENYIQNFWSENIRNITGIIGKNGSGKSTILKYFKGLIYDKGVLCFENNGQYFFYKDILVIKEKNKFIVISDDSLLKSDITINCENMDIELILYGEEHKKDVDRYKKKKPSSNWKVVERSEIINQITCIYMSNIFNAKDIRGITNKPNYYDISTDGVLYELKKVHLNLKNGINNESIINQNPNERNNRFNLDLLRLYKYYILFNEIKFISENKENFRRIEKRFKLPESIIITTDYNERRSYEMDFLGAENHLRYENQTNNSDLEKNFYLMLDNYIKATVDDEENRDKSIVIRTLLIRLIDSYFQDLNTKVSRFIVQFQFTKKLDRNLNEKANKVNLLKFDKKSIENILELIKDGYIEVVKEICEKNTDIVNPSSEIGKIYKLYVGFIELIGDIIFEDKKYKKYINLRCYKGDAYVKKSGIESLIQEDRGELEIKINQNTIELIKNIIDRYIELNSTNDFLIFKWRDLSSGEEALLETYSKLYSIVNEEMNKDIILLIDEGETYLHPEWQRQYISILIEYITEIFSDKNIQIVFASNSPFLISDMPRDNIIVLDEENGKTIISNNKIKKQTFGANISQLLSESFFMDYSMGDFAKMKMNDALDKIKEDYERKQKKESFSTDNKIYVKRIIDLIDEPLIKKKISRMYNETYNDTLENITYEIEEMENKIRKLKEKKNKLESEKGDSSDKNKS